MLSQSLHSSTPEESRQNELKPSLKSSHIFVKNRLPTTKKATCHQPLFKVYEKRKAIDNRSNGPLKKRIVFNSDSSTPLANNRINTLACNKTIDKLVLSMETLNKIKNLNTDITMPFALGSYQMHSPFVSQVKLQSRPHDSNIIFMHQDLKSKSRQEIAPLLPIPPKSTNSSKDLHTLLKNDADSQQFIDHEAIRGKYKSSNHDSLDSFENDFSSLYRGLSLNQDKDNLSKLQCLIRENIEIVIATEEDKNAYFRGRNWTVEVGQVGVRCKHCYKTHSTKEKLPKSSRYFPLSLSGIYQAAQNIYHFHFKNGFCRNMPPNILLELNSAKPSRSCYGGGKKYWIVAAESLGLLESPSGLRLKNNTNSTSSKQESANRITHDSYLDILINDANLDEMSLVNPDDRNLVTDYIFMLMCQMNQYLSKNVNDENNSITRLVLCCKHCMGGNGRGVFNRTKVTSLSKNEFFSQVNSHLDMCSHCPNQMKKAINHLKEIHDVQKRKLKRGSRKEFFNRILNRMKDNV